MYDWVKVLAGEDNKYLLYFYSFFFIITYPVVLLCSFLSPFHQLPLLAMLLFVLFSYLCSFPFRVHCAVGRFLFGGEICLCRMPSLMYNSSIHASFLAEGINNRR